MKRFVLLQHDFPKLHWDLLLEANMCCQTWRLPCPFTSLPTTIEIESISDHRLEYLDYEGPVSKNRGTVTRLDFGIYSIKHQTHESMNLIIHGQTSIFEIQISEHQERWFLNLIGEHRVSIHE